MKITETSKLVETKIVCPTCNGQGHLKITVEIPVNKLINNDNLSKEIKLLRMQGYSLRQIGHKVGIKNAGTVNYYLKK